MARCEAGFRAGERRQKAEARERCCEIKGDRREKDRHQDVDGEGEKEEGEGCEIEGTYCRHRRGRVGGRDRLKLQDQGRCEGEWEEGTGTVARRGEP